MGAVQRGTVPTCFRHLTDDELERIHTALEDSVGRMPAWAVRRLEKIPPPRGYQQGHGPGKRSCEVDGFVEEVESTAAGHAVSSLLILGVPDPLKPGLLSSLTQERDAFRGRLLEIFRRKFVTAALKVSDWRVGLLDELGLHTDLAGMRYTPGRTAQRVRRLEEAFGPLHELGMLGKR